MDRELLQDLPAAGVTALAGSTLRDLLLTGHRDGTLGLWDMGGAHYGGRPATLRVDL